MAASGASSGGAPAAGRRLQNPAFLAAPQEVFAGLRAQGAVPLGDLGWLLTRNADIAAVLTNPEVFSSGLETHTGTRRPLIPLQIDPPAHGQYRRILDPLFSPQRVKGMEGPVTDLARRLVDEIAAQDEVAETADSIYAYFDTVIAQRRACPQDDLVSSFLEAEVNGARLSREDILDICFLFLVAGLDTMSASLDCMMLHLALHPDLRRALAQDPSLIPNAVEELLRWERR
jgi:cytochrome P450